MTPIPNATIPVGCSGHLFNGGVPSYIPIPKSAYVELMVCRMGWAFLALGAYTLSIWDGRIVHYRLGKGKEGFFIRPGHCFETIKELIEHHQKSRDGLSCPLLHLIPKAHAQAVVISKELEAKWELDRNDIELGDVLGEGNYGEVYKAVMKSTKTQVAVKTVKEDSMEAQEFMQEAHVMKKLQYVSFGQPRCAGCCERVSSG